MPFPPFCYAATDFNKLDNFFYTNNILKKNINRLENKFAILYLVWGQICGIVERKKSGKDGFWMDMMQTLSQELSVPRGQIESAVRLMDEGNTIPFIARYRKEATGGLDDTVLRNLSERLSYLRNLEKRRQEVFALIEESGKLEGRELEQLRAALEKAQMLSEIEDLYRPYRPKRRTRASVARERGLEGLAHFLKEQRPGSDLQREAAKYVDPDKEVPDTAAAIAGAGEILAEELSDSARLRGQLREYLQKNAQISTTTGTKENEIYQMYSEYSESIRKIPSHRVLAIDRGEREEALKVNVEADHEHCVQMVERELVRKSSPFAKELRAVCADSFERLIFPSLTRELRAELTEQACKQAIGVFSENLKNLLMQPPVKGAVTMGFDPAYRTGCKDRGGGRHRQGAGDDGGLPHPAAEQNRRGQEGARRPDPQVRGDGDCHRQRDGEQGVGDFCGRAAGGAEPHFNEQGFLHGGQRGGGFGLLGLQAGSGGVSAV